MSERSGNVLTRNKGKIILAAVTVGAVVLGPKAWRSLEDSMNRESEIVAGVPGQVEVHASSELCATRSRGVCIKYDTQYLLGVEQCPQDVQAAKQNRYSESFNPTVGLIYPGCVYDLVGVDLSTWQKYPDGSTIVFNGQLAEHVSK